MVESPKAFVQALDRNPHLKRYVDDFVKKTGNRPEFHIQIDRGMKYVEMPNIIYPVGDPIFIHIHQKEGEMKKYYAVEPPITKRDKELYAEIFDICVQKIPSYAEPRNEEEFKITINQLLDSILEVGTLKKTFLSKYIKFGGGDKVHLTPSEEERVRYHFLKNLIGMGVLEPFIRDPWIEDISCVGKEMRVK